MQSCILLVGAGFYKGIALSLKSFDQATHISGSSQGGGRCFCDNHYKKLPAVFTFMHGLRTDSVGLVALAAAKTGGD